MKRWVTALLLPALLIAAHFGTRALPPAKADEPAPARLLVLNKADNALAVIDPESLKVLHKIPTGEAPHEVTTSADGKTAFVANYGEQKPGSTLSVIDVAAGKELRRVDLGALRRPHGLAEVGGKIYFTAEVNSAVARYDPASDRVDWIMGTGQSATHMLVAHPDGTRLFTADIGSGTVTALDLLPGLGPGSIARISAGKEPEGIALSPDGSELWAGSRVGGGITVIDTEAERVKETIPFDGVPIRLQFTPDGKHVLVSNAAAEELVVLDAATRKEVKRVPVGPVPVGVLVAPDGRRAFVATTGAGKVARIDLDRLEVTGTVETGQQPDGLAWSAPRLAPPADTRKPGLLGVAVAPVTDATRQGNNLELNEGVLVQAIAPNSAAGTAGVEVGDVIVAVNGTKVADIRRFLRKVMRGRAGDVLEIELVRRGRKLTKKATLLERPPVVSAKRGDTRPAAYLPMPRDVK